MATGERSSDSLKAVCASLLSRVPQTLDNEQGISAWRDKAKPSLKEQEVFSVGAWARRRAELLQNHLGAHGLLPDEPCILPERTYSPFTRDRAAQSTSSRAVLLAAVANNMQAARVRHLAEHVLQHPQPCILHQMEAASKWAHALSTTSLVLALHDDQRQTAGAYSADAASTLDRYQRMQVVQESIGVSQAVRSRAEQVLDLDNTTDNAGHATHHHYQDAQTQTTSKASEA